MNYYTPDRWVILEISDGKTTNMKVFSGTYGGYTGSDTWKLSSVIEKIFTDDDFIEVLCASGSTYKLYDGCYGTSGYMASIFGGWIEATKDKPEFTINVLDKYDRRGPPPPLNP